MMKKALVSQCNDNEVRLAKDILLGVYGEELLGKPLKHNHMPDNKSACREKEIEDIQNAFSIIDRNSAWTDNIKVCATKSDMIPKFHPEEANIASVLDRITAIRSTRCDHHTQWTDNNCYCSY